MLTENKAIRWRFAKVMRQLAMLLSLVGILLLGATAALAHDLPVNVSGYEVFLGLSCPIGTCGTTFSGWTGGSGPVSGGWQAFPGDNQGLWRATVNYTGGAGFGNTVVILSGKWRLAFKDGHSLSGTVAGGTVQWPSFGDDLGCGTNVAEATATLSITGGGSGSATFNGCLHDLPVASVVPPTAWGTFSTP